MAHYVAILISDGDSGWSVRLPDFPGCNAQSPSAYLAMRRAAMNATNAAREIRDLGRAPPKARNFYEIKADRPWADQRGLDFSRVIVSLVQVST